MWMEHLKTYCLTAFLLPCALSSLLSFTLPPRPLCASVTLVILLCWRMSVVLPNAAHVLLSRPIEDALLFPRLRSHVRTHPREEKRSTITVFNFCIKQIFSWLRRTNRCITCFLSLPARPGCGLRVHTEFGCNVSLLVWRTALVIRELLSELCLHTHLHNTLPPKGKRTKKKHVFVLLLNSSNFIK